MSKVLENFLRYISYDTQSQEDREEVPSTQKQFRLAEQLARELRELGAEEVRLDDHCYVYAAIPASPGKEGLPPLGFIAHMDTSPAVSGAGVKARIVERYDGGDIPLNDEGAVLSPGQYPSLLRYRGQDLVVTDGRTLLGADDKAGVAEIMAMAGVLLAHPELPHPPIRIAFTPDEEVGRGTDFFDIPGFGAAYAYTVDGGELGELEYENFNAASAKLTIHGRSIHPGAAKGKMVNALLLGMEFQWMLPPFENPACTEGYEGFYHLDAMEGSVEAAVLHYILRDHDREKLEAKKARFLAICDYLNQKYGPGTFVPELRDNYSNMKEQILPHFHLIDNAKRAMEEVGITPKVEPIRGGTDGARLSWEGLPCPNLCTGGANYHGTHEFVCVQSMEKIVALLLRIAAIYAGPEAKPAP